MYGPTLLCRRNFLPRSFRFCRYFQRTASAAVDDLRNFLRSVFFCLALIREDRRLFAPGFLHVFSRKLTTPSARNKVASRLLINRASTPPLRGGECFSQ